MVNNTGKDQNDQSAIDQRSEQDQDRIGLATQNVADAVDDSCHCWSCVVDTRRCAFKRDSACVCHSGLCEDQEGYGDADLI